VSPATALIVRHLLIVLRARTPAEAGGRSFLMANARIIEIEDEAAGIVVREDPGVRFFAAARAYFVFDGAKFRNSGDAERTIARFASSRRRAGES
jgi:hypothetical protein